MMNIDSGLLLNFMVALGIGLLIGAEREHNQPPEENGTAVAGVRTFTIAALLGAASITLDLWLLAVALACVAVFSVTAYFIRKNEDPGMTTEISLLLTVVLGGMAMSQPVIAAGLAVGVAILLAAKEPLHGFVKVAVTRNELNDFLILAAATLIVLPLVPNAFIGPYDAINPRNLWLIVILVMLISAFGHIALRLLGGQLGLPLTGLVSGFVSSVATIGAMGERARENPALRDAALSGAIFSNLATILQLTLLILAISPPTLVMLAAPLVLGGISVAIYGLLLTLNVFQHRTEEIKQFGQLVSVKTALLLALTIGFVLVISAMLQDWLGQTGLVILSGLAGLADAHAPSISVASLVSTGKLSPEAAVIPILVAFSVNAVSKVIMAMVSGGAVFARRFIPALLLQVLMVWLGWWLF
jgi:uncharacterized membrane protein (DUF4010 family)